MMKKKGLIPTSLIRDIFEDWIKNASEADLDEALIDLGRNPDEILAKANRAIENAKTREERQKNAVMENLETPEKGLGILINMLRRKKKLGIDELARKIRVEVEELVKIEREKKYSPTPRTIYQLENFFSLPRKSLMQLSGNISIQNEQFNSEIIRFAAHSKNIDKITKEEKNFLNKFVQFLEKSTKGQ